MHPTHDVEHICARRICFANRNMARSRRPAGAIQSNLRQTVNGEIDDINALITHNLNIHQFAQDVIENCEDSKLLDALWEAITQVRILDPTCGSGAFLFAALIYLNRSTKRV